MTSVRYLSPERLVVPRGVFFGPALRVTVVLAPAASCAACLPRPASRPGPAFTLFNPGFGPGASARRFLGCVAVTLFFLPFPSAMHSSFLNCYSLRGVFQALLVKVASFERSRHADSDAAQGLAPRPHGLRGISGVRCDSFLRQSRTGQPCRYLGSFHRHLEVLLCPFCGTLASETGFGNHFGFSVSRYSGFQQLGF